MPTRALILLTSAVFLAGAPANAREATTVTARTSRVVSDTERDRAIRQGARFLQRTVFKLPDAAGTPRKQFTVAVTGIVGLLLNDGLSSTARGQRLDLADRARKFLSAYVKRVRSRTDDPAKLAPTSDGFSSTYEMQYTWPIAMAGLFYGELHARGQHKGEAVRTLRTVVDILAAAQAQNGGWGHARVRGRGKPRGPSEMDGFGGYPDTLLASSNLVAASLGLLRPVTAPEDESLFDRAQAYFEYAELSNGNFPYDPSQRAAQHDMTGVSRAAGAVFALRRLGVDWDDVGVSRALELVDEHFEYLSEGHGSSTLNLLLAALLQYERGPRAWARFKEVFFPRIVKLQNKSGAFECICQKKAFASTNDSKPFGDKALPGLLARGADAYVSAIHTLILLLDRTQPKLLPTPKPQPADKPTTPR